jgi:hypothetical protein
LEPAELARRGFKAKTEEEVSNLLTTLIEIEEGLLSGLSAKAELRELLDELYDDLE